ncbi:MAG: SDR family oxidoreductase [Rhizobacter sp.]|nr:SDR family oxidoreductase [Ferruginibacter sp.]
MKILLTGATGYIAQRLLPELLAADHYVYCCARDKGRFDFQKFEDPDITVIEVDLLAEESLQNIPVDIDIAYYLVHSMSASNGDFAEMEARSAENFKKRMADTNVKQVIYLTGISNEAVLSKHLHSRQNVANILKTGSYAFTALNAGIIVGSGSASFEIIRDLVEKLPVMITPKWLHTKTQPIAIRDVVAYLKGVIGLPEALNKSFDISSGETLTYKELLLRFAKVRGLKRKILVLPVLTPKLSSYWLYFVTATSYTLAKNLVDSMKVAVIGRPNGLGKILHIEPTPYEKAIELAFVKIENDQVLSSWKDAATNNILYKGLTAHLQVPKEGTFRDARKRKVEDVERSLDKIWRIGGSNGWYYGRWLWVGRGLIDKMVGGVGLRRGRRSPTKLYPGESLDFWRVLIASRQDRRLLLYAEMKLPGEAWLEFFINDNNELEQTATFRPLGLKGRLYWYAVYPFHGFIFRGMLKQLCS